MKKTKQELIKEFEKELESQEFICPNCLNKVNWTENPFGSFDAVCCKCWCNWVGYKKEVKKWEN